MNNNSWYEKFIEDTLDEVKQLFEQLCEKKAEMWSKVKVRLEIEDEFNMFLKQHEQYFATQNSKLIDLKREETNLRRELEKRDETNLWDFSDDSDIDDDKIDDNDQINDDLSGFILPEDMLADVPDENEPSAALAIKKRRESLKREIGHMFLKFYHPKTKEQASDAFLNERSSLITSLINDPRYDAIEIILRLPFEDRDRELWEKRPTNPTKDDEAHETVEERWYRYKLWYRMLTTAELKVKGMAEPPQHDLYDYFLGYKASDEKINIYFQERELEQDSLIHQLETSIERLRKQIAQKEN